MRASARRTVPRLLLAALAVTVAGCDSYGPDEGQAEFVIDVVGERFVLRATDPETIRLAREAMAGRSSTFPIGPVRSGAGSGGFNLPWSWHLDPAEVRFTEAAIEVCDGRPSDVEQRRADYPTYCPWGGRVVAENR
ncbi:MAG TPA: hypothetical protein VII13_05725 [Vicinamibacteria bacterium]